MYVQVLVMCFQKRWSDNWETSGTNRKRPSPGPSECISDVNFLPDLEETPVETEHPVRLSKEEREKRKAQKYMEMVQQIRGEMEEHRVAEYEVKQTHFLHKTMCAIFDFINVVCLNKMLKPSQDIIFWSDKLDHKLAITYSCSSIKHVDSIIFDTNIADLTTAYSTLIHELSHATLAMTVNDCILQDHGPEFKKTCTAILKRIKENKDKQPSEIKNVIVDKRIVYFAKKKVTCACFPLISLGCLSLCIKVLYAVVKSAMLNATT